MEPISELATRVTSHLWLLHVLYPDTERLSDVLAQPWGDELQRRAELPDWSLLRDVLDLVDESLEDGKGASDAVKTLKGRMEIVQRYGLDEGIRFAATCPAILREGAGAIAPTKLLTREELFQKVANWLLGPEETRDIAVLHAFADGFLGGNTFLLEDEITKCAKQVKRSSAAPEVADLADSWLQCSPAEKRDMALNREVLRAVCRQLAVPVPFSMVLSDELDEIARSRLVRLHGERADPTKVPAATDARKRTGIPYHLAVTSEQAFKASLFGLALSGGGIRSATFGLGLLQGMADRNILPYIDVLSTVSGGGYIGSWLISWAKRRGGIDGVQQSLRGSASLLRLGSAEDCPDRRPANAGENLATVMHWVSRNSDPHSDHVRPVRLLRDYARYLAPQAGFFSADSWTIGSTWFRNTTLNLIVLVLFFAAALLLPRLAIFALHHLGNMAWSFEGAKNQAWRVLLLTVIAGLPLLAGCAQIRFLNLNTFGGDHAGEGAHKRVSQGYGDTRVVFEILPCLVVGAFLEMVVLWSAVKGNFGVWPLTGGFTIVLALGMAILAAGVASPEQEEDAQDSTAEKIRRVVNRPIAFVVTVLVGSLFVYLMYTGNGTVMMNTDRGLWIAGSAGFALMLACIGTIVLLLVGLFGRDFTDEHREWWSRLGAWLALTIGGWLAICAICFFMPLWIAMLGVKIAAAGVSWAAITLAGVKYAFSPHSGRDSGSSKQDPVRTAIMNIAPAVFVIGIVSAEAFALFWILQRFIDWQRGLVDDPVAHALCCMGTAVSFPGMLDNYWELMYPGSLAPLILMLVFIAASIYVASRVDINEFSMHNFYKNRLVRAYLGASRLRLHRLPNAFTGFDLNDDIRLDRFRYADPSRERDVKSDCKASYAGPFPIINTALNITRGAELGIQERKAESFIFTPLWSGFDFSRRQAAVRQTTVSEFAFQRTDLFGKPGQGALLGTAMAISGAAFNANAGFHTKPALAFLLTIFGVRLGWWAGNPRQRTWTLPSPRVGLWYLLKELTANTSTGEDFVLLSDGGHFENMGLYELIRRRCRYIVVSDAEEDEKFKLEGIGGAIRKCRDDFGVVIDLNLDALQPIGEPGVSRLHYSLGTIIYPGECLCGKLIYIKSSVTADEPVDIIEFRKRHSEFPHTSTADQFFDESHFESYRALGHHVASQVFTQDLEPLPLAGEETASGRLDKMFRAIEDDLIRRLNEPLNDAKERLLPVIDPEQPKGEAQ